MRGAATKARWANCEQVALALGLNKAEVFNYMYDELVQAKLLEPVQNNEEMAVARAKELPGYQRAMQARSLRVHDGENPSLIKDLGMALWFIRKAGGIAEARRLMDAAEAATKVLERKKE